MILNEKIKKLSINLVQRYLYIMTAHKLSHHGVLFLAELVVGGVVADEVGGVVVGEVALVVVTIVVISVDNGNGSIFGEKLVVKKMFSVNVAVSGDVVVSCIFEVVVVVVVVEIVGVVGVGLTGFVERWFL